MLDREQGSVPHVLGLSALPFVVSVSSIPRGGSGVYVVVDSSHAAMCIVVIVIILFCPVSLTVPVSLSMALDPAYYPFQLYHYDSSL